MLFLWFQISKINLLHHLQTNDNVTDEGIVCYIISLPVPVVDVVVLISGFEDESAAPNTNKHHCVTYFFVHMYALHSICTYIYMHACIHIIMTMYIYVCMYVCMLIHLYIYVYVCKYGCTMYIHMYVCMYVYNCVCMYVCIYVQDI